jgi:hypothetical protein
LSRSTLVEVVIGIAGFALVWAGFYFDRPILVNSGVMLIGLAIAAGGIIAMFRREITFRRRYAGSVSYHGAAAVFMGAAIALAGGGLMVVGLLLFGGMAERAWQSAVRRPGIPLMFIGAVFSAYGLALALGPRDASGKTGWELVISLPERLAGLFLLGLGAAALAVGAFEFALPGQFDSLLRSLIGPVPLLTG